VKLPSSVRALSCVRCGSESTDFWQWTCPVACTPDVRMEVQLHPGAAEEMGRSLTGRAFDHWRYREVLPLPENPILPPLLVGWTPVHAAPRLAPWLGVAEAWVKDDGRNPSASLKDRASSLGVVLALAAGSERIVCASTGNAASATACMAASVGLPATIFVPERAPDPKIAQLRVFGAQVLRVQSDYDTAWDLCAEVAAGRPWFNRNCALNPYLVEGKKTVGLELAEQLGAQLPEWVVASVGDGCSIAGLVRGLEEALLAGLIDHLPKVLGVQAEGAAPLVAAAASGATPRMEGAQTIADSLCVGVPRNPDKALAAVARTQGAWIAVSDAEILAALPATASRTGIFGEPAAVTAAAGVRAAVREGIISPDSGVAIISSGNGLKDPATALKSVTGPVDVAPLPKAVVEALRSLEG
jgi:threonine synthase